MEKDWKLVYSTTQLYKAEIAKDILADSDIDAIIINKKDSSYLSFGEIEVYVNNENKENAIVLLKDLDIE